ncbi:hypothetical protein DVH05_004649 [Phytophthora capsici]|nr:hypothetical protein DVH05_004649 [Phytophthora capsici]
MSTYPALPPHGWQRLTLELSEEVLAGLLKEAKARKCEPVFHMVGSDTLDSKRLQSRLTEKVETFSPEMKILHEQSTYAVRTRDSLYQPRTYSFMYAKSNGKEQDPHKDYIPEAIANGTKKFPGTIPCSMIVALMPGTRLKVFAGCFDTVDPTKAKVLELRPGDAVLFRADLIHCGMAYEEDNYHIHCYVTAPGPAFEPDVVAGVDEKVYTCQYCGHRGSSSSVMRLHRYYCKKNPKGHVKKKETGECKCPQCESLVLQVG